MKVLMLSIDSKAFEKGSSVSERLRDYGSLVDELHVYVYTKPGLGPEQIRYNVWLYPSNSSKPILFFFTGFKICGQILKKISKRRSKVLVTSQEGMTNILALLLSLLYKFSLEIQVHTDILSPWFRRESFKNKLRLLGYWFGAKKAKRIRVVAPRIKNSLVNTWHIDEKKIRVIPIYRDVKKFLKSSGESLHEKYPRFKHIILMVSRFSREKNIPLALEALTVLLARFPNLGLVIVGDGPERPLYERLVRNLDIEDHVVFHSWTNSLSEIYRSADIFLLTSNYEGYGLVLIEAAICGAPIVTTDVGIVGDLINPHNALIASPGDLGKIVAHLSFLLSNESARILMHERLPQVADLLIDKEKYLSSIKSSWMV